MIMHYRDDDEDSNDDFMGNMGAYDSQSNPLGLSKAELRKVCVRGWARACAIDRGGY